MTFRLIPKEERFYDDFVALAEEIRRGASILEEMLAPEQLERVNNLEIGGDPADFHFSSDLWIRCLYDTLVAYNRPGVDRERLLAGLTPLYFGRTAGFISDTLQLTTDQAERVIDDQARQFEELKPYLVTRWKAARADAVES